MSYDKPLPTLDVWSRPFWEACKDERLIAQKCAVSGEVWWPPGPVSPVTRQEDWDWVDLSGEGTVWSWVIMHQRYFAGFAPEIPYNIAQVRLDEGPILITNLVGVAEEDIRRDMRVRVVFEKATDEITLPKFTPID